jgi:Holliday junction resolvase
MSAEIAEIRQLLKELVISQKDSKKDWEARPKETDLKSKKSRKELDIHFKESDSKFKESRRELDACFKETDKIIKEAYEIFTSPWGRLMESLVEGDIIRIFNRRGIKVQDTSTRRKGSFEGENYEYDIIAHNGKEIVIIEVKTTLKVKDVKAFIQKLKKTRTYLRMAKDDVIYGAMAYLQADAGSEVYAQNQHLFVIRATGDSAAIVNADDFVPARF